MSSDKIVASSDGLDSADITKALQELAKGERTATAMENQLSAMEAKIEALLEEAEKNQATAEKVKANEGSSGSEPSTSEEGKEPSSEQP